MIRTKLVAVFAIAMLALSVAPTADAATLATWKAPIGSVGYNGYATIATNAAGTGTVRIVARHLTRRVTYPVEVRSGSCTGHRLFALTSALSSSTGTIIKTYALTAARAGQVNAAMRLYVRIGSSSRARCGLFASTIPTGAVSGTTVRMPDAGLFSDGLHLHTVQAFEPWIAGPDAFSQPAPGNVFVSALVRVDAKGDVSYNPFNYRVRDANGLQYDHVIGRDPALHSGDLANGDFVSGWLTFEVPADQATSLTLVYSPSIYETVLIRLTPLPSTAAPAPTPTPTPAACVIGCMGQAVSFGNYILTANSVHEWPAGAAINTLPPGYVLVSVSLTIARQSGAPTPQLVISGPSGVFGLPVPNSEFPAIDLTPLYGTDYGYASFAVPASDIGQLKLTIDGSAVIHLY